VDPEQSPNPARVAAAKAYHERRKQKQAAAQEETDSRFVLTDKGKVVKLTRTARGVHSVYVGTKKQADAQGLKYTRE